ncbi:MAG: hypothetical protein HUU54_11310 [Ignavibacteriaceae bacterium]|nr:hypothetical protein [Ignavibacteriaceae bacterium]
MKAVINRCLIILLLFLTCDALSQNNIFNVYDNAGKIHVGMVILERNDSTVEFNDFYGRFSIPIDSIRIVHIYRKGGMLMGFQEGFSTGFVYGALAGAVGGLFIKNNQPGTTDIEFKILAIAGSGLAGSAVLSIAGGIVGAILNIGSSIDEQFLFTGMDSVSKRVLLDKFIEFRRTGRKDF